MNETKISSKYVGPHQASPYAQSRLSPKISPVESMTSQKNSIQILKLGVEGKLKLLAEQIKNLQEIGERLILEAQMSIDLHTIPCSVVKNPGCVLNLYTRRDRTNFLSIIFPEEWGGLTTLEFGGTYRLENDMSWTRIDETKDS